MQADMDSQVSLQPSLGCSSSRSFHVSSEQAQHLRKSSRVFLPGSHFLAYWDMYMFICLCFTGVIEPYVCVLGASREPLYIMYYWGSTLVFSADLGLRFFRAQKKSTRDGVILITHGQQLAALYMRTPQFWIDLVSALPLSFAAKVVGYDLMNDSIGKVVGPLRMVRLLKFTTLRGTLFRVHDVTGWSFTRIHIFEFTVLSLLVLHWIACLWMSLVRDSGQHWYRSAMDSYSFLDASMPLDRYLMSMYWSATVLSSVGFGDIAPQARQEFVWAIICMVIGGTVWAYVVGSVCGISASLDKHKLEYEHLVSDVSVMCTERRLPKDMKERVEDFYQHSKEFMRMKRYHHHIRDLSPILKGDVVLWMYGSCFKRVWYFDVVDERCARLLAEGMVPQMYAPEDCIEATLYGVRCLVFLRSGLCVRKNGLLAPGACWGLDVILGCEEHRDIEKLLDTAQARSVNFCFVLKLCKNSINHAASLVPSFARRLRKAHVRMLFWRGVVAASRAQAVLEKNKTQHSSTPVWDRAGQMMAQVVHQDCQLIHDYEERSTKECTRLHDELLKQHEDHPALFLDGHHASRVRSHSICSMAHREHEFRRQNSPESGCSSVTSARRQTVCSSDLRNSFDSVAASDLPNSFDPVAAAAAATAAFESSKGDNGRRAAAEAAGDILLHECTSSSSSSSESSSAEDKPESDDVRPSIALAEAVKGVAAANLRPSTALAEAVKGIAAANLRLQGDDEGPRDKEVSRVLEGRFTLVATAEELKLQRSENNHVFAGDHLRLSCRSISKAKLRSSRWRTSIEAKIDDVTEQLRSTSDEAAEGVGVLREDVQNLTRLMHQLLLRFDAEEKY